MAQSRNRKMVKIIQATIDNLLQISPLFDAYRQFYGQEENLDLSQKFIKERLVEADSIIFIAMNEQNTLVGFAQLYPSFSSVAMKRTWILNDLYVEHAFRQHGVATALLHQVDVFAKFTHADSIKLSTELSNGAAKALYEREGYRQLNQFDHYIKRVD